MVRTDSADPLALHLQEVRRGTVVLACLTACKEPQYGYSLLDTLARARIQVEANTLYPLLRRLDKQGLLTAEWNTDEPRPRKYYTLTDAGSRVAEDLRAEWLALTESLTDLWKDI